MKVKLNVAMWSEKMNTISLGFWTEKKGGLVK